MDQAELVHVSSLNVCQTCAAYIHPRDPSQDICEACISRLRPRSVPDPGSDSDTDSDDNDNEHNMSHRECALKIVCDIFVFSIIAAFALVAILEAARG